MTTENLICVILKEKQNRQTHSWRGAKLNSLKNETDELVRNIPQLNKYHGKRQKDGWGRLKLRVSPQAILEVHYSRRQQKRKRRKVP